MDAPTVIAAVRQKFELLRPIMTERLRRQWAASEAMALPRGGISLVAEATGLSRTTLRAGLRELREGATGGPDQGARIKTPEHSSPTGCF